MQLDMRNHQELRSVFERAVAVCCQELDFDAPDWTVRLRLVEESFNKSTDSRGASSDAHGVVMHQPPYGPASKTLYMKVAALCNNCGDLDMGEVFCHEMVHVKQTVTGELVWYPEGKKLTFKGIDYRAGPWLDLARALGPDVLPWETEAYGKQAMLAEACSKAGIVFPHGGLCLEDG